MLSLQLGSATLRFSVTVTGKLVDVEQSMSILPVGSATFRFSVIS